MQVSNKGENCHIITDCIPTGNYAKQYRSAEHAFSCQLNIVTLKKGAWCTSHRFDNKQAASPGVQPSAAIV